MRADPDDVCSPTKALIQPEEAVSSCLEDNRQDLENCGSNAYEVALIENADFLPAYNQ